MAIFTPPDALSLDAALSGDALSVDAVFRLLFRVLADDGGWFGMLPSEPYPVDG